MNNQHEYVPPPVLEVIGGDDQEGEHWFIVIWYLFCFGTMMGGFIAMLHLGVFNNRP